MLEFVFHETFVGYKGFTGLGLVFERVYPGITGVVVDKDYVIFEVINEEGWGGPNIAKNIFKRASRDNGGLRKRKLMNFIDSTIRTKEILRRKLWNNNIDNRRRGVA